jgi:hypothetical protein
MADTVTSQVIANGPRYHAVHLTGVSDGTGETLVAKVALSTLRLENGVVPTKTSVKEIQWSIQGFSSVRLYWDHTADDTLAILAAGNGYSEFGALGFLSDPASAGGTGNILLTSSGAVSGATYDIVLVLTLS